VGGRELETPGQKSEVQRCGYSRTQLGNGQQGACLLVSLTVDALTEDFPEDRSSLSRGPVWRIRTGGWNQSSDQVLQ
jgi:hypothetical protein